MSSSGDTSNTSVSRSGITTSADGQRHIPSSTRADGSKRREIKIRPGYRPPEDIEVYKNRTAEAWKSRGSGGVPGAAPASEDDSTKASANNKNAKRREARKKAKATAADPSDGNASLNGTTEDSLNDNVIQSEEKASDANVEAEKEKKVKRLKKKLREARELQAKKEKGEGLLQEQFEKVIRINELMKDLEKLGVKDQTEDVDNTPTEK